MSPRNMTAIMGAFHDRVGLIRRLHIYTNIFPNRAANFFQFPLLVQILTDDK